jgi:iron complex transport system substrate-binding protein
MSNHRTIFRILFPVLLLALFPFLAHAGSELTVRYAQGFQVEKKDEFTLVTVTNPWPGAKTAFQYLLIPRGSSAPDDYKDYQVVEVPIRRFIGLSTTFIGYIEQLGVVDKLVGFSDLERIHSTSLKEAGASNKIVAVGRAGNLQVETVLDLEPDIIFSFATGSFRDAHPKLIEAGLKVGVIGEYMEGHPLGRSEWIKFLALFCGKEAEAEKVFNELEQRYLDLAEQTKTVSHRPTAITGTPFSGRWYVAGGKSFVGKFLEDAGADYVFKETDYTGSKPMDMELVFERGLSADFWLNPGVWKSLDQARNSDPRFHGFKALTSKQLYNNNKRVNAQGGNDYWESGIMSPDIILADLIKILHPELLPDHELTYYTHLQ